MPKNIGMKANQTMQVEYIVNPIYLGRETQLEGETDQYDICLEYSQTSVECSSADTY